jgi:hypothetical protein
MRNTAFQLLAMFLVFLFVSTAYGAPKDDAKPDEVLTKLRSGEPDKIDEAIRLINKGIAEDPYNAGLSLKRQWMTWLYRAERYEAVADISRKMVIAQPMVSWMVSYFQIQRTRSLLKAGKPADALAEAKVLYRIAMMEDMAQAMQLMSDCLAAAYPDKPEMIELFRKEQVDGEKETGGKCTVLEQIPAIDPKPFEDRLATLSPLQDRHSVGKHNLLLIIGRCAEARQGFEKGLIKAKDEKARLHATADLVKAMKAEDGTVGRANAWLKKNQP